MLNARLSLSDVCILQSRTLINCAEKKFIFVAFFLSFRSRRTPQERPRSDPDRHCVELSGFFGGRGGGACGVVGGEERRKGV